MAGFRTVDTTGFDDAIAAFGEAKQSYTNARELLNKGTDDLKYSWKGEGGDKFKSVSREVLRLLQDDGESLEYVVKNLQQIRAAYIEADTTIAGKIDGTDINISGN